MEELQRRLEFPNRTIKLQAIKKLSDAIVERYKSSLPINESTLESAELNLLWEKCSDSDLIVCRAACECAVSLVVRKQAEFGFVLSKFITLASIARNFSGVVNAVGDLLVMYMTLESRNSESAEPSAATVSCPFTRSSSHPFTTLFVGQPDCWPVIVQLFERLFTTVDTSKLLVMMEPFVKFVFSDSNHAVVHVPLRLSLWSVFLQNISKNRPEIVRFLLDLIPVLQTNSSVSCGTVAHLLSSLGRQLLASNVTDELSLNVFLIHSLVMASGLLRNGTDVSELICTLSAIVCHSKDTLNHNVIILHCVHLIPLLPLRSLAPCLKIVHLLLSAFSSDFDHLNVSIAAMLILPVLQILASPELFACDQTVTTASNILSVVENRIHVDLGQRIDPDENLREPLTHLSADGYAHEAVLLLLRGFHRNSHSVELWLKNAASATQDEGLSSPYLVSCLVAAMLVMHDTPSIVKTSLITIQQLSTKDATLSVQVLSLLLYKLGKTKEPALRLEILDAIPKCATHKMAVGPVLATLRTMSAHPKLRAVSLRLMLALWKHQERCFVHLLQMLENSLSHTKSQSLVGDVDDVLLARAECIRSICEHSATKHGEEVLAHLHAIVNDCGSPEQAPAMCLALQGLRHLCEAEVVDLRTAWNALSVKLGSEKRSLVLTDVTKLLSLAPELELDIKEYRVFTSEIVSFLWSLTRHSDSRVAGDAFIALARFLPNIHSIENFPEQIRQLQRTELAKIITESVDDEKEDDKRDEKEAEAVLGICFVRLLQLLPSDVVDGFESLLWRLISCEASNFPRGLTFSVSQTQTTKNRALKSIPDYILDQFESNQKPGSRPNLAVGLLFCYESPSDGGHDSKRRLQNTISRGKDYHHMLYTLINDIPVEPSKWYQCIAKIPAWATFMDRCFNAYTECRVAELELELVKGKSKDPAENQLYQKGAWLWARDKLTDLIKNSSRGSPVVQSNCLSALAGLALSVSNYVARLDTEILKSCEALTEHLRQPHWFTMVAETLLTVVDAGYQSKGRIFAICTQKTSNRDQAAQSTILARASASVSISLLVPLLMSANAEMIYTALNLLAGNLPGRASDTVSDVLQMHSGIGVGFIVQKLIKEHFVDVTGSKGIEALWKAVRALEEGAFSASSARSGCLVGLAICVDALCMDVKLDARSYGTQLHNRFIDAMTGFSSDRSLEPLPMCLVMLVGSSYVANIAGIDAVNKDIDRFIEMLDRDSENVELCRAIGVLLYVLQSANYPNIRDLIRKLSSAWKNDLNSEKVSEMKKVAALTGLSSIVGSHSILAVVPSEDSSVISELGLEKDAIAVLKSSHLSWQPSVQNTDSGVWLLGPLYLSRLNIGGKQQTALPHNYHFLPPTSVLRPSVDLLTEFSKKGPSICSADIATLSTILRAMTNDGSHPYPPLNWPAILGPILRLPYGSVVEELCLRLAIQQSAFLPSLSSFVSSCLVSPFYNGLQTPAKLCISGHLHVLIKVVPLTLLRDYLENSFVEPLNCVSATTGSRLSDDQWNVLVVTFDGFEKALKEKELPQNVPAILWKTLEDVCQLCLLENTRLWSILCRCLKYAPEDRLDIITLNYLKNERNYLKGFFIRCCLVGRGNQPLVWINQAIEAVAYNPSISSFSPSLRLLVEAFIVFKDSSLSESCEPLSRVQWLLELMGHIKNLVIGATHVADQNMLIARVVSYLMLVFMSAVISWSDAPSVVILGLSRCFVAINSTKSDLFEELDESIFGDSDGVVLDDLLLQLAPGALGKLLSVEPWKQLTGRIAEWMLTVYHADAIVEAKQIKSAIKNCLFALYTGNEFKTGSMQSRIVMLK